MRSFDRLLSDIDEGGREEVSVRRFSNSTCFWISYGFFMMAVGAISMFILFKYVVMS